MKTKYKQFYACFLILLLTFNVKAQNVVWAKSYGSIGDDYAYASKLDQHGNVYLAGLFLDSVDFDPGPGKHTLKGAGGSDAYISKLDSSGSFLWTVPITGIDNAEIISISIDKNGNVYAVGDFMEAADFDPGPGSFQLDAGHGFKGFIAKYSSSGSLLWAGLCGAVAINLTAAPLNGIYVTGIYIPAANDIDPGPGTYTLPTSGGWDAFVARIDSSGNLIWANPIASSSNDIGNSIDTDPSGNVVAGGGFYGAPDFDPGVGTTTLASYGQNDTYVAKYEATGGLIWAKHLGGTGSEGGACVRADLSGNVYAVGTLNGLGDYDPGPGTFTLNISPGGSYDISVTKLDGSGNFLWAKQTSGTNQTSPSDCLVSGNEIIISGSFKGTTDFDPSSAVFSRSAAVETGFMMKMDNSGALKNFFQLSGYSRFGNINENGAGALYASGGSTANCDFEPEAPSYTVANHGQVDAFCVKYSMGILTSVEDIESDNVSGNLFPNPTSGAITLTGFNKDTKLEVYNANGQKLSVLPSSTDQGLSLNLEEQPSGIYFLRIGLTTKKIIKE